MCVSAFRDINSGSRTCGPVYGLHPVRVTEDNGVERYDPLAVSDSSDSRGFKAHGRRQSYLASAQSRKRDISTRLVLRLYPQTSPNVAIITTVQYC